MIKYVLFQECKDDSTFEIINISNTQKIKGKMSKPKII